MSHATHTVGLARFVNRKGFTLLELSIVLTIVALIIGGVFIGKNLKRQAQVQAVVGEVAKYTQAVNDFRDKYIALPGDFTGAEALWGSDVSCPNTPYTATPHTATCNGNGDGRIGADGIGGNNLTDYEWFRAWQQLSDAGMIDGTFNGIAAPAYSQNAVIGVNVPASQLTGAGYTLFNYLITPGYATTGWWPSSYTLVLGFGAATSIAWTAGPILTPAEAASLDSKLDDGLPAYGRIVTYQSVTAPNCTTSDTASSSQYNTTYSKLACPLAFWIDK
jgi:prepilin-type N-terminal cleavage/methylation domain-containing protein